MKRLSRLLIGLLVFLAAGTAIGQRLGDDLVRNAGHGEQAVPVILVDHGYHAGLIFRRADVTQRADDAGLGRLADALRDFQQSDYVEIGWGDEEFYRHVPRLSLTTAGFALRALLGMNQRSVLRVVGYSSQLPERIPPGIAKEIVLSQAGSLELLKGIEASFAEGEGGGALPLPAADPYGQYFAAVGRYSIFNVCNHWAARLLHASGRPVNIFLATHSRGLFWQVSGRALP